MTETTDDRGTHAFKPSRSLLRASLALGASPCCLRTSLRCAESNVSCGKLPPEGGCLMRVLCLYLIPPLCWWRSPRRFGHCRFKLLFFKRGGCEATPRLEEKQQFRLWKFPAGTACRGSKGGPAVRRGRRSVELPLPARHDAWSLRIRQKGLEVAEPGWR